MLNNQRFIRLLYYNIKRFRRLEVPKLFVFTEQLSSFKILWHNNKKFTSNINEVLTATL